jgi:hypothetical protein
MRRFMRPPLCAAVAACSVVAGGFGSASAQFSLAVCGSYFHGACGSPNYCGAAGPSYCPLEPGCPDYSRCGAGYGSPVVTFFAPRQEPIAILSGLAPAPPVLAPPLGLNFHPAPQIGWVQPLDVPAWQRPKASAPSTAEAQLNSLRTQQHGDRRFRQQDYRGAVARYREAIEQAPDRGEAHLRLAVALTLLKRYDRATEQLRLGLRTAPDLLDEPPSLDDLFGEANVLAKNNLLLGVAEWVQEDPADPQRPYVLGLLMLLDGDEAMAAKLLERGNALGGEGDVLAAFLNRDAEL